MNKDVLRFCLIVFSWCEFFFFDIFIFELAFLVSEFLPWVTHYTHIKLVLFFAVIAVVRVLWYYAIRFIVFCDIVFKIVFSVHPESHHLQILVKSPAHLEVARITPRTPPRVLDDPLALPVFIVTPAQHCGCVAANTRAKLLFGFLFQHFCTCIEEFFLNFHTKHHWSMVLDKSLNFSCGFRVDYFAKGICLASAAHLHRVKCVSFVLTKIRIQNLKWTIHVVTI